MKVSQQPISFKGTGIKPKAPKTSNPYSLWNVSKKLFKKGDVVILHTEGDSDIVAKKGVLNKVKFLYNYIRLGLMSDR